MKEILRDFWRLARPFWFSEMKWKARGLLAAVVALNLFVVFMQVKLSFISNAIYTNLQKFESKAFLNNIYLFTGVACILILAAIYAIYLRQMLEILWRQWLNKNLLDRWLADKTYYLWHLNKSPQTTNSPQNDSVAALKADNPDQRISDDVGLFIGSTLTLSVGLLKEVVTLCSFVVILWGLSGAVKLWGLTIPGYMVWVALIYSALGTWITFKIGRPLVRLSFNQQRFEADYRYHLVRLRDNSESVALSNGESAESRNLLSRFVFIVDNFWQIMNRQKILNFTTNFYGQLAIIFPLVVAAPRYFAKEIQLGDMMQTASAFAHVQGALSFFVDAFTSLADWRATVQRLTTFESSMKAAQALPVSKQTILSPNHSQTPGLHFEHLSLSLPDGRTLLPNLDRVLAPGDRLLVSGPSGCGKSSLIRTVAGLWPYASGQIKTPTEFSPMILPQKPYLPIGTLKAALCYPSDATQIYTETCLELLKACELESFASRLDETANWQLILSGGEAQRVALARVFLQKPAWLFLDEATSALDEATEGRIYERLRMALPDCTIMSVSHRTSLAQWHDYEWKVAG